MHHAVGSSATALPRDALVAPSVQACARHDGIEAPLACPGCAAPLCSACARSEARRFCPACCAAAGRPPAQADVGWLLHLLVDQAGFAGPRFARRAVPVVGALAAVSTLAATALVEHLPLGEEPELHAVLGALLGAFATWFVGSAILPSMTAPVVARRGALARVARAGSTAVVAWAACLSTFVLPAAVALALGAEPHEAVALLGGVAWLAATAVCVLVLPLLPTAQAAAAFGALGPLRALSAPFRAGAGTAATLVFVHVALATVAYAAATPLFFLLAVPFAFGPWAGAVGAAAFATTGVAVVLWLQGVYGVAAMRYVADAARAQR